MNKKFLSIRELAECLSLKPKTLYHWAAHGKIPAYKLNGVLLFDIVEIVALIKKGLIQPKNPFRRAKKMLGNCLLLTDNRSDSDQETLLDKRSSHV
jgi:excisionase family DNA binding protein